MTTAAAVQAATDVIRGNALSIAQILAHESALMDLPTFFRAAGAAESTGYQWVASGEFPLEVIPILRRRFVRTVDAWRFLGLLSEANGASPEYQPGEPSGNDEAAGYQPAAPVEQVQHSTAK